MDRAVPTSSKLVSKRINDKNRQIHLSKLNNVKSTISRLPPKSFNHMKVNKKKHQLNEDRLSEIERENKILLDKMTTIMRITQHTPVQPVERAVSRSLNVEHRKRELVKIAMENQSIMQRLNNQKPILNRQSWEESRKQHELYLRNICEYPNTGGLPALRASDGSIERPQSFQISRNSFNAMISPKQTSGDKFYTPNKELTTSKSMLVRKTAEKLDPLNSSATQKTILYQTKKKIGLGNYLIHVYLNNDVFNIMASNNERGDFKILSISLAEGEELVRRFGSNYRELVNRIRFKGSKIVFETNTSTYDPNDKTSSQLMTNEGIVEDEEETEGDSNTTGQQKPQLPTIPNKGIHSPQEPKSPNGQPEKAFTGRRSSKPVAPETQNKEQSPKSKEEVKALNQTDAQSAEVSDTGNDSHGANASSQGQVEASAASGEELKKVESTKSQKSQKSEKSEKVVSNEQEAEKVSVAYESEIKEVVEEDNQLVEEKEPSEKVTKSQMAQIVEESVEFQESKGEPEKVKESISEQVTEKASEIREEKESQGVEEEVEEVIASKASESKDDSK